LRGRDEDELAAAVGAAERELLGLAQQHRLVEHVAAQRRRRVGRRRDGVRGRGRCERGRRARAERGGGGVVLGRGGQGRGMTAVFGGQTGRSPTVGRVGVRRPHERAAASRAAGGGARAVRAGEHGARDEHRAIRHPRRAREQLVLQ
jgi:hypothetical protein